MRKLKPVRNLRKTGPGRVLTQKLFNIVLDDLLKYTKGDTKLLRWGIEKCR